MTWTTSRPSAARTAVRAGAFVAALASGAFALTACSSGSSSSADAKPSGTATGSAAATGSATGGGAQAMDAYRQCLAQHGLNLPTFQRPSGGARPSGRPSGGAGRGFGGGGFPGFGGASPDPATQKALQACASKRPQFGGRGGGPGGGVNSSAFQAFTSCLKDHGVTLPTASPGASNAPGAGRGFGAFRGLNTADPKTAKAYDTCKALLPQRPTTTPS
jgi:hypothetical protein